MLSPVSATSLRVKASNVQPEKSILKSPEESRAIVTCGNDSEGCHGATVMIPDSTVKFKPQSLQQSSNTSLTGTRSRLQVICPRILSKDRFTLRLFSIAMVFNKSATEKLVTERSIGSL